jgi:hypothetical protein
MVHGTASINDPTDQPALSGACHLTGNCMPTESVY